MTCTPPTTIRSSVDLGHPDACHEDAMTAAPRSNRTGARLFAMYAVASLVPVLVLGAVLIRGYRHDGLAHALDQGRAQAAVIDQMAIAPAVRHADLSHGLSHAERNQL